MSTSWRLLATSSHVLLDISTQCANCCETIERYSWIPVLFRVIQPHFTTKCPKVRYFLPEIRHTWHFGVWTVRANIRMIKSSTRVRVEIRPFFNSSNEWLCVWRHSSRDWFAYSSSFSTMLYHCLQRPIAHCIIITTHQPSINTPAKCLLTRFAALVIKHKRLNTKNIQELQAELGKYSMEDVYKL